MVRFGASTAPFVHPISTLLVDDCFTFRQGLKDLLDFYSLVSSAGSLQFQIVGQASSVQQAIALAIEQSPMLILLDLELSQGSGLEVLQQLRSSTLLEGRSKPQGQRVLVLSEHLQEDWVYEAMQAGALGYVLKQNLSVQLLEAIQVVLRGQVYLAPEVATCFFQRFQAMAGRSRAANQTIHLTEREREVLYWLVQGASNEVISQQLCITVGTVKAYLTTIFEKLRVTSRTQAALKALKLGLISI